LDLVLYAADSTTLVRGATNDFNVGNTSPETVSLAGVVPGTYYIKVYPHRAGTGIDAYTLAVTPPAATGDDAYEPDNSKATVDAAAPGAANSPNFGVLTSALTIPGLVMADGVDLYRFQTLGVGTTADSVTVSFD